MLESTILALMLAARGDMPVAAAEPRQLVATTVYNVEIADIPELSRESPRTLRQRVERERRSEAIRKGRMDPSSETETLSYSQPDMGISIEYPDTLQAHEIMEAGEYSDSVRVVTFSKPRADFVQDYSEYPVTRLVKNVEIVHAVNATEVGTITLTVKKLDLATEPTTLDGLTENYVDLLDYFFQTETTLCDCDKNVGGAPTRAAYSYALDGTILLQTWTMIDEHVYIFTMVSEASSYDKNYEDFLSIIGSMKLE